MTKWESMTPHQRGTTLANMHDRGGAFAKQLSLAFLVADPYNEMKLASAFPEIIERYAPVYASIRPNGSVTIPAQQPPKE